MSKHNFFIYSNFDFTFKSAGSTRMKYYAQALADENNNVYLVSCSSTPITDENFEEIEPNIFIQNKKKLTKGLFKTIWFLFRLADFSTSKKGTKQFIFYPSPLIYLEVFSLIYLKAYKKYPVFYELNEVRKYSASFLQPLSIRRPKYSVKKIIYKSVFTITELLLFFYDGLICISTAIEKYGKKFNKNTIRIPILTNPFLKIATSNNIYFKEQRFNIGFSGSIQPDKENLDEFIKILIKIKNAGYSISFNLCGPITSRNYNTFLKTSSNFLDVNYYGNLEQIELSTFLNQQDLLVIPRGYSLQNKYGFSTKLSDYLNHKKLILVTDISDNVHYIKDGVNGFIVPVNSPEQMYNKLIYILVHKNEIKDNIIKNALNTSINEFYFKNFSDPLKKFLTN